MDANAIIDNLLERIKGLTKENAFMYAELEAKKQKEQEQKSDSNE